MTSLPGVLERSRQLLGFEAVPGTLNLRLAAPLDRRLLLRYLVADEIAAGLAATTGQAGYFWAPVRVADRFRGIAFQADEPDYPADLVEIICEVRLRDALALSDGDHLDVELLEGIDTAPSGGEQPDAESAHSERQ